MRNIRKFETFEDFLASQESVSGSANYVQDIWPGFAYIKENFPEAKYAVYNGEDSNEYEFGDIIYYDGSDKLKKVYWSAFTPSMGEKVGLIVVPSSLSPDGNARMMAFGSVVTNNGTGSEPAASSMPESKGNDLVLGIVEGNQQGSPYEPYYMGWYYNMVDENQSFYTSVPAFYYGGGAEKSTEGGVVSKGIAPGNAGEETHYEYAATVDNAAYSSDVYADGAYPNPYTQGEGYGSAGDAAISPFLGDTLDRQDPAYLQETLAGGSVGPEEETVKAVNIGGTNWNAFSDFSGYTWTYGCPPAYSAPVVSGPLRSVQPDTALGSAKPVGPLLGGYFPHDYVREFYTDGTATGDWYLPSMGEMGFVVARFNMIATQIMPYLYNQGALDSYDNFGNTTDGEFLFTSTFATVDSSRASRELLGTSVRGNQTYPNTGPVVVVYETGKSGGRISFNVDYGSGNYFTILPFAMIKDGNIQRTMGDYTAANGHQIKDITQED